MERLRDQEKRLGKCMSQIRMDDGIETKLLQREDEEGDLKERIWDELKKICRVALPSVISRVCAFGTIVVTQSFVGHISDIDLAGYALVQTLSVRFVNGILLGMSSATETLCGQAFGAGQTHMMGIYLQRSWIVDLITLTVLLPVFIFGTQIFRLVGEEESLAKSGGYISLWFIPFIYNFVFSLTIQMYLQAQLKNMIIAWLSAFQFAIHIPLSMLFVYKLNMGIAGAMIALSMSSWFLVIGEFIYIFGGWCPNSWKGFTIAAFKDLLPVVKLSLSSGVMLCLELWYYAVLVLLAGYMEDAEVAISAFSICLNVNAWEIMISLGFLGAACVRVANELGRGNAKAVKFSIKVLLGTSLVIGVFFFVLCLVFGRKLAYLFTDDDRVAHTVSDLSWLLSVSVLLNSIYPVLSGVAIGAGMQAAVAIVNLVCFYGIGIPIGALLGYLTSLEVKGIWIGMIGGVLTQTITLVYMTWRTDWDVQIKLMDDGVETKLLRHEKEEGDLKERIWDESKKIWRVALPGVISRVCAFGTIVVTQSFVGHISDLDLAAYALVQTLCVRFVNGILLGMSSATETLCGQAFGAGQTHMMSIYLQRSWIVDLITLTVLLPVFIFGTQIFRLFGEEESLAKVGGYMSLWFIPFVYNFVFSLTIQMYLQAQLKNMIIAWLSAFQFAIHIPLSMLFVYKLNMGIEGAMIALSMSSWFLVIGEFIYIFGGWCPNSWKGFTIAAFKDLLPVVKLSLSSGVMVCLELWYNAVLVLLAGYMEDAEIAISAFSICLNVNAWEFMISLGFLGAACVRVANELGRGNAKAVKFSIKVVLGTSLVIGVFFFVLCLVFGRKLAYLFTDDDRVADTVSDLSWLLSISVLLNSIYPVLSGVAVGAGMQAAVAVVNLVCFYGIGIPIGALLGYLTSLEVKGIWIGMIGGVLTQTITLIYMTWRTDWDVQVTKASERLTRFYLKSDENEERVN
ncbi:Multi antimicrobial extrusion protein [Artemisia annua]|uniref:Protein DETOXIFICATION n=1 Tax=Artemisia annua TaxID=35608 RepID=A0A2U1MHC9_ARTAN|nr:Multi antimicrobial extrusion protein [Artemisia annua]